VIDRNISLTNICTAGCRFCAFHVAPDATGGFTLSIADVVAQVKDALAAGATQVLIQGGLNPDLKLPFYEALLTAVKAAGVECVHSLSPAEITYLAENAGLSLRATLERLRAAGLDSLPGGGAEILVDSVRQRVSPRKLSADGWVDVMRTAQQLGMRTTATMVYGLGETTAQRVEHLQRIRDLQDETGGFTAFIPWSFQSPRTNLSMAIPTGIDYLRVVALARLFLDNIPHIQAGWVTEGPDVAQLALHCGADDFGGVLMEEQVVRATGTGYMVTRDDVIALIRRAGFQPVQRTTQYAPIRSW
jgi:cyclic dehypoxanthinyl futalosine synthase